MSQSVAVKTKPRPALKLVKTNDLSRDEWLDVRRTGIGSSDAAASVGLNPYQSQLELWMEKTGRGGALPQIDPNDDTSPMFWGSLLESFVAAHYTKKSGNRVRKINAVLQHPEHTWMLANIDREVIGAADVQILECKTAGMNGSKLWKEGVPEYVQLQVQHQLCVTGKHTADVAVLVCGNEYRCFRIERNDELIARLIQLEAKFWDCVIRDIPPAADGSESAAMALQALYPNDNGEVVDFSEDTCMNKLFSDYLGFRQQRETAEEQENLLKQRLQERLGFASGAVLDCGKISWRKSKDSTETDFKKLTAENPELVACYEVGKPGSRRFLVQIGRA